MTETSGPFGPKALKPSSITMTENQWSQMFRYVLGTGVMSVSFQDELEQLLVVPSGAALHVDVQSGAAWIQGHYYQNDAPNTLTISPNTSALTRADLIVLECKWGLDAGITAKVIEGTPGAVWPVTSPRGGSYMPPVPVQTYGVMWQLPLAQVNTTQNKATVYAASDIIDWRSFVGSGGAKSSTYVVAADSASPLIRANADAVIPWGSINAEQVINDAIITVAGYGGGTVLLSEGTHHTSDSIDMLSNVALKGLGTKTLIQYHPGAGGTNNYPVINCDSLDNVTISDLSIDGGGADLVEGSETGLGIDGYNGISIANGTFNVVRNCWIKHCKSSGIELVATVAETTSYGHRVEGCLIGDCSHVGLNIQASGGIYTNNQVNHNGYGIYLWCGGASVGASMNIVANNTIRNTLLDGLMLASVAGTSGWIKNNSINHNIVYNSSQNTTNTYSNICLIGAAVTLNLIEANSSQQLLNGAKNPHYGIYVDNLNDYNFITSNFLYGCGATSSVGGTMKGAGHNRAKYNFWDVAATPANDYGANGYASYWD